MTAKLTASADGSKVLIGTAAEDALQIDANAKTVEALALYQISAVQMNTDKVVVGIGTLLNEGSGGNVSVNLRRGSNNEQVMIGPNKVTMDAGNSVLISVGGGDGGSGFVNNFGGLQTTTSGQGTAAFAWTGSSHSLQVFTSSRRFKQNIVPSKYGLAEINRLQSVTFNGIQEWDKNIKSVGFIAEDVAEVIPEAAQYGEDDLISGIHYNHIISVLTKAVQELSAKVAELEAKCATCSP